MFHIGRYRTVIVFAGIKMRVINQWQLAPMPVDVLGHAHLGRGWDGRTRLVRIYVSVFLAKIRVYRLAHLSGKSCRNKATCGLYEWNLTSTKITLKPRQLLHFVDLLLCAVLMDRCFDFPVCTGGFGVFPRENFDKWSKQEIKMR